jgi:hypothetical protein
VLRISHNEEETSGECDHAIRKTLRYMPENNILSEDVSDQYLCLIQKTYFRFSVKDRFTGNSSATDWYHDDDGLPLVSYPITSQR